MWYKISLIGWSVLLALFVKALVLAFMHPPESQEVFPNRVLDEPAVRCAALGSDKDLMFLIVSSRERALSGQSVSRVGDKTILCIWT